MININKFELVEELADITPLRSSIDISKRINIVLFSLVSILIITIKGLFAVEKPNKEELGSKPAEDANNIGKRETLHKTHSCRCGNFKDNRDGHIYKMVTIGSQVWMADNLGYKGAATLITDSNRWSELSDIDLDRAYCYYDNDSIGDDQCLYTWAAANVSCPPGWHLPSDSEWSELSDYLITNGYNWDGTNIGNRIGKSLSSKSGWYCHSCRGSVGNSPTQNNRSGFNALPGGNRNNDSGLFSSKGANGRWWSSTESHINRAYYRGLNFTREYLSRGISNKSSGYSVRCVKNAY